MSLTAVSALGPVSHWEASNIQSYFEILLKEIPEHHFFSAANMRKLLEKYSGEDLALIYQDLIEIREQTFVHATKQLNYVVTAGGPASGKSTILEDLLESNNSIHNTLTTNIQRAYIDPDRSCLLRMERTYKRDISTHKRDPQNAYEYWREASNFLANYYLAKALKEGYAIAHGSTMATPFAKNALIAIRHLYRYTTTIIHLTCEEEVRYESKKKREESGIVQGTEKDFQEKQTMFFTLLEDYVSSADKVLFSYRPNMDSTIWAAKAESGQLLIYDESAINMIKKLHEAAAGEVFWSKTIENLKKINYLQKE